MTPLPSTVVTFVFTDIEGSTTRWEHYPAAMQAAMEQHDSLMRSAFAAHGGQVIQKAGDSFVTVFARASDALAATVAAQCALHAAPWPTDICPLRARSALHSGPGEQRADGYHAEITLNRLSRLTATSYGGQILVTATTRHLLDQTAVPAIAWRDLGEHRLKDVIAPLHVYQVLVPGLPHEFPPLKTAVSAAGAERAGVAGPPSPWERAGREADVLDAFERLALAAPPNGEPSTRSQGHGSSAGGLVAPLPFGPESGLLGTQVPGEEPGWEWMATPAAPFQRLYSSQVARRRLTLSA
jgi:class 3 adenylate cyclase